MPSSMNKDGSNLRKSSFGCCFHPNFVNLKRLMIAFGIHVIFMIHENVEEVLFLIWNTLKVIRNLRSRIA